MEPVKIQDLSLRRPPQVGGMGRVECRFPGCTKAVPRESGGRPYCSNHIHAMPYVARVSAQLRKITTENALVSCRGILALPSIGLSTTAQDIVCLLHEYQGVAPLDRFVRFLCLGPEQVSAYAEAMARAGMVRIVKRGRRLSLELA